MSHVALCRPWRLTIVYYGRVRSTIVYYLYIKYLFNVRAIALFAQSPNGNTYPDGPPRDLSVTQETLVLQNPLDSLSSGYGVGKSWRNRKELYVAVLHGEEQWG
jgi:hypothetical protein